MKCASCDSAAIYVDGRPGAEETGWCGRHLPERLQGRASEFSVKAEPVAVQPDDPEQPTEQGDPQPVDQPEPEEDPAPEEDSAPRKATRKARRE